MTRKQIVLAAHFPGVNNQTIWSRPESGSQIDIDSFTRFAATAERGRFDYLFLAEGLRLREHKGEVYELDVLGRPNTLAILAALAGVTSNIGLVGTLSATFNEPYELARQLATLDALSDGRAGWNIVTTSDAFHGANFRRGAFLPHAERYTRAEEFLAVARQLWDSWAPDAVAADSSGFLRPGAVSRVEHHGAHFDVSGYGTVPRTRQGHPLIVQAGDSPDGRDFAARDAEVIFSRHPSFDEGRAFYTDVTARLEAVGRSKDSLKILPGATFVLGDSADDAADRARSIAEEQITPQTAIAFLEQVWGRDLTSYDPDGPLPDVEPVEGSGISQGRALKIEGARRTIERWRALAAERNLSIRQLVLAVTPAPSFVGTAATVAAEIDRYVQGDAADGFVLIGHTTPGGLDEFVDSVIPLLQERGSFRSEYPAGATLRELLFG